MQKLVIFGNTSFSKMTYRYILEEKVADVGAFCIDKEYKDTDSFCDKPLIAFEDIERLYPKSEYKILNTIGYTKMNEIRRNVSDRIIRKGYTLFNYISKKAEVYSDIKGYNNIILPNSFIGYDVEIGNNNVFYTGANLTHDIVVGNNNFFAANSTIGGNVVIKDNCFFGMNCTVKNRVSVESKTLVGAGAYVEKNTEDSAVIVPVRSIVLDKKSYELI